MNKYTVLPNTDITSCGPVSNRFLELEITTFLDACKYVHKMPYGYNSDRDDLMILFKENIGTCTTKHSVIATLSMELGLTVKKNIGIYSMTEDIVNGTDNILSQFSLPYIPMVHCFLAYENYRVDLTEGNHNGKNRSIEEFLYIREVEPNISAKDEYRLYREALKSHVLIREEMENLQIKQILQAREQGLKLLKSNIL